MRTLVRKLIECDGVLCENLAIYGLAATTFTIMYLSIAQISQLTNTKYPVTLVTLHTDTEGENNVKSRNYIW